MLSGRHYLKQAIDPGLSTPDNPSEGATAERTLRPHIPALDGVRGFAAAVVFVLHYGGGAQSSFLPFRAIGTVIKLGWSGVGLFFVLSGFLISGILWESFHRPHWWRRFFLRRSLRIFPLYYLAISIAALVGVLGGASFHDLNSLWVYIFYLRDVPALVREGEPLNGGIHLGHFWSLAVEEQFYLLWPFLLGLFAGRRRRAIHMIVTLWMLSLLFRIVILRLGVSAEWGTAFLLARAGDLLAGAYLAMAVRGGEDERQRLFRSLPVALWFSLALLVAIAWLSHDTLPTTPWMMTAGLGIFSIFFASLLGLSLRPGYIQRFFSLPLLRWFGKISYGIYVYHLLFQRGYIWVADRIASGAGFNAYRLVLFVVAMVGTLSAASLSYYCFESFFLRWKDRVPA